MEQCFASDFTFMKLENYNNYLLFAEFFVKVLRTIYEMLHLSYMDIYALRAKNKKSVRTYITIKTISKNQKYTL